MSTLHIERVLALPGTLLPTSIYIVKSADAALAEIYFTSDDGLETRHIIDKNDVATMIAAAASATSNIRMVLDITARDALTHTTNGLILVADATGDVTVAAGAALYFYDFAGTTYIKVSEFESLDVTLTWDAITDGPASTPVQVDAAVAASHAHANATQLAKIGEDVNGDLTYNGALIKAAIAVNEW